MRRLWISRCESAITATISRLSPASAPASALEAVFRREYQPLWPMKTSPSRRSVRRMVSQPRASHKKASHAAVHLTPTETAILTLLPTHRTLAAIGDRLGISRPTVKTHVQNIYRKLGATNRAEAVESAESAGLLPTGNDRAAASAVPRTS